MKHISIKLMFMGMAVPIVLDVVAIIMGLHGMAGGAYSEGLIDLLFKGANWPSILFRLTPFDHPGFNIFDCLNPKIIIFNIVVWGILGLFSNKLITRLKKPLIHPDN